MPHPKVNDGDLLDRLTGIFRDSGYEGATLRRISKATGLEKASLYHRFPRGKEQMAEAVLRHVGGYFAEHVLAPLREPGDGLAAVRETGRRLSRFYEDGGRACLVDTLSLGHGSAGVEQVTGALYGAWRDAFAAAARRMGASPRQARVRAEEAIGGIHGGLVMARATGDRRAFRRAVARLPELLGAPGKDYRGRRAAMSAQR